MTYKTFELLNNRMEQRGYSEVINDIVSLIKTERKISREESEVQFLKLWNMNQLDIGGSPLLKHYSLSYCLVYFLKKECGEEK